MKYQKTLLFVLAALVLINTVSAGMYANGTVYCDTNDTHGYCAMIEGPAAGFGMFIQYISSPMGSLLIPLVLIGIIAAVGFALAFIIKRVIIRD